MDVKSNQIINDLLVGTGVVGLVASEENGKTTIFMASWKKILRNRNNKPEKKGTYPIVTLKL